MNIEWLKNSLKERFYPITHAEAVIYGKKTLDDVVHDLEEEVNHLAPEGADVGQLFVVKQTLENGRYIMEPVNLPSAGQMKIKFAGTEQAPDEDGYVDIPIASLYQDGLLHLNMNANESGLFYERGLKIAVPSEQQIDLRNSGNRPITAALIPYVYKSAATAAESEKDPAWTEEEQIAAQHRLGILSSEEVLFG